MAPHDITTGGAQRLALGAGSRHITFTLCYATLMPETFRASAIAPQGYADTPLLRHLPWLRHRRADYDITPIRLLHYFQYTPLRYANMACHCLR